MWALINNNVITTPIYAFTVCVDFILGLLLILCLYEENDTFPYFEGSIEYTFELHRNLKYGLIFQTVTFGYLTLLALALMFLVFKNLDIQYKTEHNVFLKMLSFAFGMLRSAILSVFIFVSLLNLKIIGNDEDPEASLALKYLILTFACISLILIAIFIYISSFCYTLAIFNNLIPWAEISQIPYLLDCTYKFIICLAFVFRESNGIIRYVLTMSALCIQSCKFLYRIRKSFIFNQAVLYLYTLRDVLVIHLLIFLCLA